MGKDKVSMRNAVVRMDQAVSDAVNGKANVAIASVTIGEVRALERMIALQVQISKATGKPVKLPDLDFIDLT